MYSSYPQMQVSQHRAWRHMIPPLPLLARLLMQFVPLEPRSLSPPSSLPNIPSVMLFTRDCWLLPSGSGDLGGVAKRGGVAVGVLPLGGVS